MATQMAICLDKRGIIILLQKRQQLSALALEIKGIRFRGGSICAHIKRKNGIAKRKKVDVYREFHAQILKDEKMFGIPERPLTNTEKEILGVIPVE